MNYKKLNITSPVLILNKKRCLNNIYRMHDKAAKAGTFFRPHFKTHQSHIVGRWFREAGVKGITVTGINMAEYFFRDGWDDITIAFPVNLLEIERISKLSSKIKLNILISSQGVLKKLVNILNKNTGVFLDIDTGDGRTGFKADDIEIIRYELNEIKNGSLGFDGFLTHAGHSYNVHSPEEILNVHKTTTGLMKNLKKEFIKDYPEIKLSVGDTPTCSIADDFSDIDEIRPGNFVFYDWMQYKIGSCKLDDIALIAACPVVVVYPDKNEAVIHGGAVHLSKDFILNDDGSRNYGMCVYLTDGWRLPENEVYIKKLSQVHGIVHLPDSEMKNFSEGSVIGIIPVHSCLTADCMGKYYTEDGEEITIMRK